MEVRQRAHNPTDSTIVSVFNALSGDPVEIEIVEPKKEVVLIPPHRSLTAGLRPASRQGVAALRLAEEGRRLVERSPERAVDRLERSIALETSPYAYYYLALAHYRLERHRESLNFLEAAESWLGADPRWMSEMLALRTKNTRALETRSASAVRPARASLMDGGALSKATGPSKAAVSAAFLFILDVGLPAVLLLSCFVWTLRSRNFD